MNTRLLFGNYRQSTCYTRMTSTERKPDTHDMWKMFGLSTSQATRALKHSYIQGIHCILLIFSNSHSKCLSIHASNSWLLTCLDPLSWIAKAVEQGSAGGRWKWCPHVLFWYPTPRSPQPYLILLPFKNRMCLQPEKKVESKECTEFTCEQLPLEYKDSLFKL